MELYHQALAIARNEKKIRMKKELCILVKVVILIRMEPNNLQTSPLQDTSSENKPMVPVQQKSKKGLIIIIVLGISLLIGGTSYLMATRKQHSPTQIAKGNIPSTKPVTITPAVEETYTDATLGATFTYPSSMRIVYNDWTSGKTKDSYEVTLQDKSVVHENNNTLYVDSNDGIYIGFENNPQNYSLAQFYQQNFPGGMQRYANIAFETFTNPNGIQFQRIIRPYKSSDAAYNYEVMHDGKYYSITKNSILGTKGSQDLVQRDDAAFTQIITSFKFMK